MSMKKSSKFILLLFYFTVIVFDAAAQQELSIQDTTIKMRNFVVDYNNPVEYIIGGIEVTGLAALSVESVIGQTGLMVGDKIEIPGEKLSMALKSLWQARRFSEVALYVDSLVNGEVFLLLELQERPRISRWQYTGTVRKGEMADIDDRVKIRRGMELSDYVISTSSEIIRKYYAEKGFLNTKVDIRIVNDTIIKNAVHLIFEIEKNEKVKIQRINFSGNENVKSGKLARSMKKTRDRSRILNIFSSKKFDEKEFENDKRLLVQAFNEKGYRDARIVRDTMYYMESGRLGIDFEFEEGDRYYFRDITWTGNSIYSADQLNSMLRISKGDVYDVVSMNERLMSAKDGNVNKMYTDNGYLFFRVTPVEKRIDGDSVDVEMRMFEGKPADINRVIIDGNTVTNENVARRELYVRPGYRFSQTYFEQSIQRLSATNYFDQEKLQTGYTIMPDMSGSTVDLGFNLEERSSSEFELSAGWSGSYFVGTLGVSFNNFSVKNLFDKQAWRPFPAGDGQSLSLRFQTNGTYYTALSASFVEPWLTGKKPTSLNLSVYYTRQTNSSYFFLNDDQSMQVYGLAAGLGSQLKWPDNYFVLYNELSFQSYKLTDWDYYFLFKDGLSHNFSYKIMLQRNTSSSPVFPRYGSEFQFGVQLTPPYSAFRSADTDYSSMEDSQRYRWIEYHKWTFKGTLYTTLVGNLVLMTRAHFGYLGTYNRKLGYSPFEGYILGGDGMTAGYNVYGSDIIGLRGYTNQSLTPIKPGTTSVYEGNVYDKFTLELRYPIVMEGQTIIYALAFLEGGNSWSDIRKFNPFAIKRSAGAGVRITLPAIGMLGIDWGYGFDYDVSGEKGKGQIHFVIGQQF